MKSPYSFPHRSRKAMIAYLLDRKGYSDHYTPYPFSWNVKAHSVDWYHPKGEYQLNPAMDSAWESYVNCGQDYGVEYQAFESAQDYYRKDWTSYPGDDQGEWEFAFYGRSGGHLCLESWRGNKFNWNGRDIDLEQFLQEMPLADLRAFYRGIRCADSDFTSAKASKEVEYHLNFIRNQWEEEQNATLEQAARALEASRSDMYGKESAS